MTKAIEETLKKLRQDASDIFKSSLDAVDPYDAVCRHLSLEGDYLLVGNQKVDCPPRVYVIGFGKAAAPMAQAVEKILGDRIAGGIVTVKEGHSLPLKQIRVLEASHPIPDERGLKAAGEIVGLVEALEENDLLLCMISGGGSALLPLPAEGISLANKGAATQALLDAGASIHEMNALRKHLSKVKGGQLARLAYPATMISLVLSDVVGDNPDTIASGPTVPDGTTFTTCLEIIDRLRIRSKLPGPVLEHLEKGAKGARPETPKSDDPIFGRAHYILVGHNTHALQAAAEAAQSKGYQALILSSCIEGETRDVARMHAAIAKQCRVSGHPVLPPACVLSGGETTVTIRGPGKGGRNQEFALAAGLDLSGHPNVVLLSAGTDGTDGPTNAAGAVVDGTTVLRAETMGLDPRSALDENDAYPFFQKLGDLYVTGPTRTNVMDVRIILIGS